MVYDVHVQVLVVGWEDSLEDNGTEFLDGKHFFEKAELDTYLAACAAKQWLHPDELTFDGMVSRYQVFAKQDHVAVIDDLVTLNALYPGWELILTKKILAFTRGKDYFEAKELTEFIHELGIDPKDEEAIEERGLKADRVTLVNVTKKYGKLAKKNYKVVSRELEKLKALKNHWEDELRKQAMAFVQTRGKEYLEEEELNKFISKIGLDHKKAEQRGLVCDRLPLTSFVTRYQAWAEGKKSEILKDFGKLGVPKEEFMIGTDLDPKWGSYLRKKATEFTKGKDFFLQVELDKFLKVMGIGKMDVDIQREKGLSPDRITVGSIISHYQDFAKKHHMEVVHDFERLGSRTSTYLMRQEALMGGWQEILREVAQEFTDGKEYFEQTELNDFIGALGLDEQKIEQRGLVPDQLTLETTVSRYHDYANTEDHHTEIIADLKSLKIPADKIDVSA